jgi:hypothetical protein
LTFPLTHCMSQAYSSTNNVLHPAYQHSAASFRVPQR